MFVIHISCILLFSHKAIHYFIEIRHRQNIVFESLICGRGHFDIAFRDIIVTITSLPFAKKKSNFVSLCYISVLSCRRLF